MLEAQHAGRCDTDREVIFTCETPPRPVSLGIWAAVSPCDKVDSQGDTPSPPST